QERLVLADLPDASGGALLRPEPGAGGSQCALPSVRRLQSQLLRLQPYSCVPGGHPRRESTVERQSSALRWRAAVVHHRVLHTTAPPRPFAGHARLPVRAHLAATRGRDWRVFPGGTSLQRPRTTPCVTARC